MDLLFFFAIPIVIIAVLGWYYVERTRSIQIRKSPSPYVEALSALVEGDEVRAYERLKETVRQDTNHIDAYLKIGVILRNRGNLESAIRIHRDLTFRGGLSRPESIEIYRNLAEDYQAAKEPEKALLYINKILDLDSEHLWALEKKAQVFELMGSWDQAFEALEKYIKKTKGNHDPRLALYKVQEGVALTQQGKEHEGRTRFNQALSINEACSAAYLQYGDSYVREGRVDDALKIWSEFIERNPKQAYLVFDRLQRVLFEKGSFDEIEQIYESILQRDPDNLFTVFALADLYNRRGETEKAISLCKQVLEKNPESSGARRNLIRFYHKTGKTKQAVEIAIELADLIFTGVVHRCRVCGFKSHDILWRCPQCDEWDTFENDSF